MTTASRRRLPALLGRRNGSRPDAPIEGTARLGARTKHLVKRMRPGDVAAFPKGRANGHHLVNRSEADCVFVAVGKMAGSDCHYPDIDLHLDAESGGYTRKDGTPYVAGTS